jgi:hypothetical protein
VKVLQDYLSHINKNQGLIFTTASGKPINPSFLIEHFKYDLKAAGLPEI